MTPVTSLVGKTIAGRFRIEGPIGEGAMAVVYRGKPVGGGPDVAVKVMQTDLEGDPTFVGRFKREARAAAKLEHPNTVRIIDFGEAEGRLYMVMELLVGLDLFDTLKQRGAMQPDRAVRILIQVCRALEAAHALGIVHRDLKPENVFLLEGGEQIKVLDFGIAKILERDDAPPSSRDEQLTTVGMVVGTPEYMSPEQCMGVSLDERSDIYSCGIVLFQMLTRRPPFYGGSQVSIAIAHMEEPPPKLTSSLPGLDPRLEALVERCLAKLPEQRFQTAKALREALEQLATSGVASGKGPARESDPPMSRAVLSRQPIQSPTSGPLSRRNAPAFKSQPEVAQPPAAPVIRGRVAPSFDVEDGPASTTRPNLPAMDLSGTLASVTERRPVAPRIEVVVAPPPAASEPRTSSLASSIETGAAPLAVDLPGEDGPSTRRSIPFPAPKAIDRPPQPPPVWAVFALVVFVGVVGGILAFLLIRG